MQSKIRCENAVLSICLGSAYAVIQGLWSGLLSLSKKKSVRQ